MKHLIKPSIAAMAAMILPTLANAQYVVKTVSGPNQKLTGDIAAISENGWVGGSFTPAGSTTGHIGIWNYNSGLFEDLGAFPSGATTMSVFAVNTSGQVLAAGSTGYYVYAIGAKPVKLPTFPATTGPTFTEAFAMNDAGMVVGDSNLGPFVFQNGNFKVLAGVNAFCINDSGIVGGNTGPTVFGGPNPTAVLWNDAGAMVWQLLSFPASIMAINSFGTAAGLQGVNNLPFVASGSTLTEMGNAPGSVIDNQFITGIDDSGHVAGYAWLPNLVPYPYIWYQGTYTNLNSIATLPNKDKISGPGGIDIYGRMLVYGTIDNEAYGYVLIPPIIVTTSASPAGAGHLQGYGGYTSGQTMQFSATPFSGYFFNNWTLNGSVVSEEASFSVKAAKSEALVANFTAASLSLANPTIVGGAGDVAKISLGAPAPRELTFRVSSSNPHATVPAGPIYIAAGATSVTFNVKTTAVTADTAVTIAASGDASMTAKLTIAP